MKGLQIDVYRPADGIDCTNGGISSRHGRLTVVGIVDCTGPIPRWSPVPAGWRAISPHSDSPAVWLQRRRGAWADSPHVWSIVPAGDTDPTDRRALALQLNGWMSGGNYAGTTDARFREIAGTSQPVTVHDRREW